MPCVLAGRLIELTNSLPAVKSLEYLLNLPEMAALVSRKNAKSTINVVVNSGVHRGLDLHPVNGKSCGRAYRFRELKLRLYEAVPRSPEVPLPRCERREDFVAKTVGRLKVPDEQPCEAAGPERPVRLKIGSSRNCVGYRWKKCARGLRKMAEAFGNRPRIWLRPRVQMGVAAAKDQLLRLAGRMLNPLDESSQLFS